MQQVIIAGGRDFNDEELMCNTINTLIDSGELKQPFELISGMAKGADLLAYNLLKRNDIVCHEYHADWKNLDVEGAVIKHNNYGAYNAVAGHQRNARMADDATHLLAFWDGKSRGTKDMIERMKHMGKPVQVVRY